MPSPQVPSSSATGPTLGSMLQQGIEVSLARGYTVQRVLSTLVIRRNLSKSSESFKVLIPIAIIADLIALGCVVAGGFLGAVYGFMTGFVGAITTYNVMVGLFSRQTVEAGRGHLIIRTRPLPWIGDADIDASRIESIEAVSNPLTVNGTHQGDVMVRLKGGTRRRLLTARNIDDAEVVAESLRSHLGIEASTSKSTGAETSTSRDDVVMAAFSEISAGADDTLMGKVDSTDTSLVDDAGVNRTEGDVDGDVDGGARTESPALVGVDGGGSR